ncbi:MAG: SIMPL domain-containing protein [Candidatus Paceibacterota bacterium]
MDKNFNKIIITGIILGLCFIAGLSINAGMNFKAKQLDNTLSVTGSAKQQIISDSVKWRSSFFRTTSPQKLNAGYTQMKIDEELVASFIRENGIDEKDVIISPVSMAQIYKYDSNAPTEYELRQTVEVQSSDVDKITQIAKNIQSLIEQEVLFSSDYLEYYYSRLPELRVSLLSDAIKDAKVRAEKIAESSGKSVGPIRSASMGVVQVLPVNSVDISDYGSYDTRTIEKEVMVTVKALFTLE